MARPKQSEQAAPEQSDPPVPLNRMIKPGMVRVRALRPLFNGSTPVKAGEEFDMLEKDLNTFICRQLVDPVQ
jgi:hypothetical protein